MKHIIKLDKSFYKRWRFIVVAMLVVVGVMGSFGGCGSEPQINDAAQIIAQENEPEAETETEEVAVAAMAPVQAHPITSPAPGLIEAVVSRVIDGDTVVLESGERVRLIGIDAPEIGQPGADEATAFVRERVEGRTVWLSSSGADTDRFDRLRRYVWIQPPTDTQDEAQIQRYQLNALLLEYGHAVVMIVGGGSTPRPETAPAPPSAHVSEAQAEQAGVLIGNVNSQVFHNLGCSTLPAPANRIYFSTREDAVSAGHRPCGRCRP